MKQFFAVVVIMFVLGFGANVFGQQPVQPQTQNVYSYGMPEHRIAIRNTAPWPCRLVTIAPIGKLGRSAENAAIADIAPGETIFAGNPKKKGAGRFNIFRMPSLVGYDRSANLEIPLVCLYFSAGDDGLKKYVGAAGGVLWVPGAGNSSVSTLTFGPQNIRFADDTPTTAPTVMPQLGERCASIPFFGAEGTSIQVFIWNSSAPAHITINGGQGDTLNQGNIKAYIGWGPTMITISAVGSDGTIKSWSRGFQNSDFYNTHAEVFILGMRDLH